LSAGAPTLIHHWMRAIWSAAGWGLPSGGMCSFSWRGRRRRLRRALSAGSLTHGSDYLVRYAPRPLRAFLGAAGKALTAEKKPKPVPDMMAFADVVQPMLQQQCVSCHGPEKSESELRLDSLAALFKGGKSGPVLV